MQKRLYRVLLAVSVATALSCQGATSPAPVAPDKPAPPTAAEAIERSVEDQLLPVVRIAGEERFLELSAEMKRHRIPAISIAVFENHEIVWAKAYGVAEAKTSTPATTSTLFQAASISKPVNGLAAAILAAKGTLALDAPVNETLTSWKLPSNALTNESPVTLRQLLTHTAGTTVHGFAGYATGADVPSMIEILDGKPPANSPAVRVDKKPGGTLRYSGGGISIAQLAMTDATERAYPELMRELVLDPLGMADSTFEQPLPEAKLEDAAAGHVQSGEVVATKRHVYPEMAAAGLWTTPSDLARFLIAIGKASAGLESPVTADVAKQMTTPQAAQPEPDTAIALSMFLDKVNDQWFFGHGGANHGFRAIARASRDGGYGFVIMANSDNGFAVFETIERTLFARAGWPGLDVPIERVALSAEQRTTIAGRFAADLSRPFAIKVEGERAVLERPFREPVELVPTANGSLVSLEDGTRLVFDAEGDWMTMKAPESRGGRSQKAERLGSDALLPLVLLAEGKSDEAVSAWRQIAASDPDSKAQGEASLNQLGYELIAAADLDAALTVLRFVTVVRPDSSNAFDSLGEVYALRGETELAIKSYEISLAKLATDKTIPEQQKPARRKYGEDQLAKLRAK